MISSKMVVYCEHCEDTPTPATVRCVDCEQNFCDYCKKYHDNIKIYISHKWASVEALPTQRIFNEIIFCKKHPAEEIKLHCRDCNDLVCLVCTADDNEHKSHHAEPIHKALDRILPQVQASQKRLENKIQLLTQAKENAVHQISMIKMKFTSVAQQMNKEFDETLKSLKQKH